MTFSVIRIVLAYREVNVKALPHCACRTKDLWFVCINKNDLCSSTL